MNACTTLFATVVSLALILVLGLLVLVLGLVALPFVFLAWLLEEG